VAWSSAVVTNDVYLWTSDNVVDNTDAGILAVPLVVHHSGSHLNVCNIWKTGIVVTGRHVVYSASRSTTLVLNVLASSYEECKLATGGQIVVVGIRCEALVVDVETTWRICLSKVVATVRDNGVTAGNEQRNVIVLVYELEAVESAGIANGSLETSLGCS